MSKTICIGVGPVGDLADFTLLGRLARIWRNQGLEITTTRNSKLEGDLGFSHIDTTRIADDIAPCGPPGMQIVNSAVRDISKRHVSRQLVGRDDGYDGAVVIKTDDNYYGQPRVPHRRGESIVNYLRKRINNRTWRYARLLPFDEYPILERKSQTPGWVWNNNDIVVERFIPEIEDGYYVLRIWVFLGSKEFSLKIFGREPIVKAKTIARYEIINGVPDELRAERKRLKFDYGKFDYVMRDGRAVLLDANKTPTAAGEGDRDLMAELASGIDDFLA